MWNDTVYKTHDRHIEECHLAFQNSAIQKSDT